MFKFFVSSVLIGILIFASEATAEGRTAVVPYTRTDYTIVSFEKNKIKGLIKDFIGETKKTLKIQSPSIQGVDFMRPLERLRIMNPDAQVEVFAYGTNLREDGVLMALKEMNIKVILCIPDKIKDVTEVIFPNTTFLIRDNTDILILNGAALRERDFSTIGANPTLMLTNNATIINLYETEFDTNIDQMLTLDQELNIYKSSALLKDANSLRFPTSREGTADKRNREFLKMHQD